MHELKIIGVILASAVVTLAVGLVVAVACSYLEAVVHMVFM